MMSDGLPRTNGKDSEERSGPEHKGETQGCLAAQARFCLLTLRDTKVARHGRPQLNPALYQLPEYHSEQAENDDHQPPSRLVLLGFLRRAFVGLHGFSDPERQVSKAELKLTAYRKLPSFADFLAAEYWERLAQIEAAESGNA